VLSGVVPPWLIALQGQVVADRIAVRPPINETAQISNIFAADDCRVDISRAYLMHQHVCGVGIMSY
jgi:hypothetical protein